jgi:isoaspartyl peptidase/L-asparaginase-like protein (Ntn-hydrolase superfamily)
MRRPLLAPLLLLAPIACRSAGGGGGGAAADGRAQRQQASRPDWVLVVHGGSGKRLDPDLEPQYRAGVEAAMRRGAEQLERGGSSLDAVEAVVSLLEDDPLFNAGKGAVFTHAGTHELDAAIMSGRDRAAGAVAALRTVRHPIRLARLVMERTPHVLLVGEGAEAFATAMGVERVDNSWFDTPRRRRQLEEEIERQHRQAAPTGASMGTVGAVALDRAGHLAAATSTGGTTNKLPGRVGDSPLVGAGTWADDASCAVSGSGKGEQFIRHAAAARVSMLMAYGGRTLAQAADDVIGSVLRPDDGGLIAVGSDGSVAMPFSTEVLVRGVVDARGRFEVAIGHP